jgi:hypothetical protein
MIGVASRLQEIQETADGDRVTDIRAFQPDHAITAEAADACPAVARRMIEQQAGGRAKYHQTKRIGISTW